MSIKHKVKLLLQDNPLAKNRRKKMRRTLKNDSFTLLTPNCLGGILLHDLGLRFLTPTINLMMTQTDFLQFVLHLDEYLKGEFRFFEHSEYSCPCAHLHRDGLRDVDVHFTHYKTEEEAEKKWRERAQRICRENLFVFLEERDGISRDDLIAFGSMPARGLVAFTCNPYPELPYCVYLETYHSAGEVGNILEKNALDDSRKYERFFDFVKWFNEAENGDHDVSPYVKPVK